MKQNILTAIAGRQTTARWTAQDPLAEKYYAVSPYAYYYGTLNKK